MKKTILVLAILATFAVSCNKVVTPAKTSADSTVVAVDSVTVDSTLVSDDEARDYLKDTVK